MCGGGCALLRLVWMVDKWCAICVMCVYVCVVCVCAVCVVCVRVCVCVMCVVCVKCVWPVTLCVYVCVCSANSIGKWMLRTYIHGTIWCVSNSHTHTHLCV